jgi:hypothetical protein
MEEMEPHGTELFMVVEDLQNPVVEVHQALPEQVVAVRVHLGIAQQVMLLLGLLIQEVVAVLALILPKYPVYKVLPEAQE